MKTKFLLFLISILVPQLLICQQSFSLQEAINYAQENHLDVKSAQLDIADAQQQIYERRSIGIPKIKGVVDYSHAIALPTSLIPGAFLDPMAGNDDFIEVQFGTKNSMNIGLELNSLLFDFSYLVGLRAARAYKTYVQEALQSKQYEIEKKVIDAYLPTLIMEASKKTIQKNIENLKKLQFETQELYKEGFIEKLDVDRLTLSIANLNTELSSLDNQLKMSYQVLKFNMGLDQEEEIVLTDNIENALELAENEDLEGTVNFNNRADYRTLLIGEELNDLNVELNRSLYYPSLNAFGYLTYNGQGDNIFSNAFWNPLSAVGLQLNVPIYSGGEIKAKLQRAKLDREDLLLRKKMLEDAISLEVNTSRLAYTNALERMDNQKANVALSENIYNTTLIKYKEGVGSSVEVSQAEQALFQTQQNFIQSQYEVIQAKSALDKALGKN